MWWFGAEGRQTNPMEKLLQIISKTTSFSNFILYFYFLPGFVVEMQAELRMRALLVHRLRAHSCRWLYLINITGQEFPLQTKQ